MACEALPSTRPIARITRRWGCLLACSRREAQESSPCQTRASRCSSLRISNADTCTTIYRRGCLLRRDRRDGHGCNLRRPRCPLRIRVRAAGPDATDKVLDRARYSRQLSGGGVHPGLRALRPRPILCVRGRYGGFRLASILMGGGLVPVYHRRNICRHPVSSISWSHEPWNDKGFGRRRGL